jgi:hypothetical protein
VAAHAQTKEGLMPDQPPANDGSRPGVMGDWTEEQNLGQPGNPKDRITEEDVKAAFEKDEGAEDEDS